MMVASALGIQVTSLVAVLSVAGLAISPSVQGLLSNVLSGLMLLFIKPFKVGDYVEVGGGEVLSKRSVLYIQKYYLLKTFLYICPTATCQTER